MTRFYGPGKQKPGYQPRKGGVVNAPPEVKPQSGPSSRVVRFVLKSGAALELIEDSIDDIRGVWADRLCNGFCGEKEDGSKAFVPAGNVDYMEEVK